jgi:hypothetical protein
MPIPPLFFRTRWQQELLPCRQPHRTLSPFAPCSSWPLLLWSSLSRSLLAHLMASFRHRALTTYPSGGYALTPKRRMFSSSMSSHYYPFSFAWWCADTLSLGTNGPIVRGYQPPPPTPIQALTRPALERYAAEALQRCEVMEQRLRMLDQGDDVSLSCVIYIFYRPYATLNRY